MLPRSALSWRRALAPLLLFWVVTPGCDSSTDPDIDEAFIGDWSAESFVIDGVEMIVPGPGAVFNFSVGLYDDASYQLIVSGDPTGFFCGGPPGCNASGDYDYTGSTLIFDPGTADEVRVQYAVVGNEMTVSGSAEGTPFTGVLRKR
jgi:hypothetical protein